MDLTDPDSDYRVWPVGVVDDRVYLQGELKVDDTWCTTLGAVSLAGDQLWQRLSPIGLGAVGVTADGEVIANAGGKIFAISEDRTGEIGVGIVHAVIGHHLVVDGCDAFLSCGVEIVDLEDGSRTTISADRGTIEHRGGSPTVVVWSVNDGPQVHAVLGDEVVPLDVHPDHGELGLAVDQSGVVAVAGFNAVTVSEPSGVEIEIEFDRRHCCMSRVGVVFLTAGG